MQSQIRSISSILENNHRIMSTISSKQNSPEPDVDCIYPLSTDGNAFGKHSSLKLVNNLLDRHLEFENNNISISVNVNSNSQPQKNKSNASKSEINKDELNLSSCDNANDENFSVENRAQSPISNLYNDQMTIRSFQSGSSISTTNTSIFDPVQSIPRTIKVFNNNYNSNYNYYYDMDYDYNSASMDYEHNYTYDQIDESHLNSLDHDHNDLNNDLNKTYNNNCNFLFKNVEFAQSLTSVNSSIDNFFSPPISRAGTPLKPLNGGGGGTVISSKCATTYPVHLNNDSLLANEGTSKSSNNFKKRKTTNSSSSCDLSNFHIDSALHFSPLSKERVKLIEHLAKNEHMNSNYVEDLLSLFKIGNLDLKLHILKQFVTINSISSINDFHISNLQNSWILDLKKGWKFDAAHCDAFQLYKNVVFEFIKTLTYMNSFISFITQDVSIAHLDIDMEKNMLEYASTCLQANNFHIHGSDLKIPEFDPSLLEQFVYLLWKTEDTSVCNNFRSLIALSF